MKKNERELEAKLERYRSDTNLNKIRDYQSNPQQYLEDEKNMGLYSKLIERDIVQPYLKNKELAIIPAKINEIFNSSIFVLGISGVLSGLVGIILEPNIYSGGSIGLGVLASVWGLTFALKNHKKMYKVAKEIKELKKEWDLMKNNSGYVKDFMRCNGVHIEVDENAEEDAKADMPNMNDIISPLNEEWIF